MPEGLASANLLAMIKLLPEGAEQSVHCDSPEPGNSALSACKEGQSVLVMINGFRGMVILERLTPDREVATNFARSSLAAQSPPRTFNSDEWTNIVEPCVWEFLVHQQFTVEKLPPFEVVRVPLDVSETIILDYRCPHAGDRWRGPAGCDGLYRWHFYGFRRDVIMRTLELTEESSETTVDLCEPQYLPIFTWAQKSSLFK